jgi:hypothetical protein
MENIINFKDSNSIVISSRNLDYFKKYLVLFIFSLLVQLKQIKCDNVPLKNSPMTLNIISLSQGIESVSSTYRNTFLQLLNEIKSESQISKEKYDKIVKCEEGVNNIFQKDLNSFFKMYSSTGIQRNDYGDYKLCMEINNSEYKTFFAVVERFEQIYILNRVETGICLPIECKEFIQYVNGENEYVSILHINFKIQIFPREKSTLRSQSLIYIIWAYLMVGYILLIIIVNFIATCLFDNQNPYKTHQILVPMVKNKLTFHGEDNFKNNITKLQESQIKYSSIYSSSNSFNQPNRILKIYFQYFSLSNNFYLLSTTKSDIYNDQNLKFTNGIIFMFIILHIFSCIYSLIIQISKKSNFDIIHDTKYPFKLNQIINNFGRIYLEVIAFIWGIIITFKFNSVLNFSENDNSLSKILNWFFRQFDKIFIFIILNLFFLLSLEYLMHKYNSSCILWFLYEEKIKDCSIYNFVPFYDFLILLQKSDISPTCLNSNRIFFEGFYILFFSFLLLYFTIYSKRKIKILGSLSIFTLISRSLFCSFYLYSYTHSQKGAYFTQVIFDYLHGQFFFNLPNLFLGMIVGYIYFLDVKYEEIENSNFSEYFSDVDIIRKFFTNRIVRNLLFLICLPILILFVGRVNHFIENFDPFYFNLCISLNGFVCTLFLSVMILTTKLKSDEMWGVNQILKKLTDFFYKSQFFVLICRCTFTINMSHVGILYFIVLNMVKDSVYLDFFNIIIIYGIPICILIFSFSFLITLFIEVPLRILIKKKFKIAQEIVY